MVVTLLTFSARFGLILSLTEGRMGKIELLLLSACLANVANPRLSGVLCEQMQQLSNEGITKCIIGIQGQAKLV